MQPNVCILRTDGTNCDEETAYAFQKAGGLPRFVHVNELRCKADSLMHYAILAIPGGFSYGDDIAAGAVLANELISYLRDQLQAFVDAGRLVIGVCNGFQVLVRTGLLPLRTVGEPKAALAVNDSGRFECRWVQLVFSHDSPCVLAQGLVGKVLELPVAHGEGKFMVSDLFLHELHAQRLAPLRYHDHGRPATRYPYNPNGSLDGIAGVCDPTGRVFGLMPHPERFVERTHHPNWRRFDYGTPHGLAIFGNAVNFAKGL
ncbi:MAG: phosphoribosylformylglycinamidine synthase I [bacterium]|nr:phosphoribosylformylglycinamidine synthase I [bacterium]